MDATVFLVMATRPLFLIFLMFPFLALCVRLTRRFAPPKLRKILLYKLWTADHEK